MAIPTFDQFIHPLLKVLAKHPDGIRSRDAYQAIASNLNLSDEDQRALLPSGRQAVFHNRIGWAHDRLKRAGLSRSPSRGRWQLTNAGRDFANTHGEGINDEALARLARPSVTSTASEGQVAEPPGVPGPPEAQSPEERIDAADHELRDSLSADLLEAISGATPTRFESLVLDVLHAMGYGATRADLQETKASGDEGVDGVITLDRLGLEKVYVQAKRWTTGTVGRPEIQKFVGALAGQGGTRGVFITTSTFSHEARRYAEQVPNSLVLIDGPQLAGLMVEYQVGVSVQRTIKIARLDSDYFDEM